MAKRTFSILRRQPPSEGPGGCSHASCTDRTSVKKERPRVISLECACVEVLNNRLDWKWKSPPIYSVAITNHNTQASFHPVYSSGTATVIADRCIQPNMHYFWEIKVLTYLYGTDVIFGVGPYHLFQNEDARYQFISLIGSTKDSWGLSYHGDIIHNGLSWKYTDHLTIGTVIGIHLDTCAGKLEFHINGKPAGVAFDNIKIKDLELYPMVSSTAAKSAVKLTCSINVPSSLQLNCLQTIKKHPKLMETFHHIDALKRLYLPSYFWALRRRKNSEDDSDAVTPRKRIKSNRKISLIEEPDV